uniref:Prolyl 4-hydroxylase alpha subunit Fe(2+) 2OG dioxygenase domain-containing protein n=1 Tax=Entomoneis paludosa TaxID=265537 RepID=A0A7S3DWL8_9STRA
MSPPPSSYETVLTKLRDIVAQGKWPETSVARSSVILNGKNTTEKEATTGKAGSFTVINTKVLDQRQRESKSRGESIPLPLGNQLFPDLAQAIFDLEEAIAARQKLKRVHISSTNHGQQVVVKDEDDEETIDDFRPSHCAVNCNAQFTPHVDSGRGAGQSLSVIVGLGDYHNGEIVVEGLPCDIRFQPLRFDGWSLRHWTNPYEGERFSLVWFTPAPK